MSIHEYHLTDEEAHCSDTRHAREALHTLTLEGWLVRRDSKVADECNWGYST